MKIFVKAKPAAREDKIEKIGENCFRISIKEPPVKGKANFAILKLLSDYFKVPLERIKIISGFSSRDKVIEINK